MRDPPDKKVREALKQFPGFFAPLTTSHNPFSIDNILAPRPRLPTPYYSPGAQAAADFY
ncbi:unnamed protein product, partial [Didymodactylos carnosus]